MTDNRLADALSPYLLQHRDQPVHWQPWDLESLALARRLDRPILLSIGYSACHWCHVMAHESFDDSDIADLMNEHFVNIKVDREERPDLDRIYQLAHQLLTGRGGGWPLTVFLDPESHAPFFAGTYYPPEPRSGMMGFNQLLDRIQTIWNTRRDELGQQQRQVQQALSAISQPRDSTEAAAPDELAEALMGQLASRFDQRHGGFGGAPKFPQAPLLEFLSNRKNDEQAEQMLSDTLIGITRFGLQDQLGGGFFRYATDAAWEIPHFEKMLSDNALLLGQLAQAAHRWPHRNFQASAEALVEWLQREMALPEGGFAASQDADSDDGEGRYYLWTKATFEAALPPGLRELASEAYGLDGPPNFDDQQWHLLRARDEQELRSIENDTQRLSERLASAQALLLEARSERTAPDRDDKLIGSWNGLMIESLAQAGRLLDRPDWLEAAAQAFDAVAVKLFGNEPPYSVWRSLDGQGKAAQIANLDDHANVLLAGLELLSWRFEPRWFNLVRRLARRIQRQFIDPETGACFFTPLEQSGLVTRPLAFSDDATPAGSARAVEGLTRLGHLCGDPALLASARWIVQGASGDMASAPLGHAGLITAANRLEQPAPQLLIGGAGEAPALWHRSAQSDRGIHAFHIAPDLDLEEPSELIASIQSLTEPTAILCVGECCLAPIHDEDDLRRELDRLRTD
ncbi:MAG: thioredoxin domain-containing protein [Pseudomonadota bacterium]